jgi:hypothetical protein
MNNRRMSIRPLILIQNSLTGSNQTFINEVDLNIDIHLRDKWAVCWLTLADSDLWLTSDLHDAIACLFYAGFPYGHCKDTRPLDVVQKHATLSCTFVPAIWVR